MLINVCGYRSLAVFLLVWRLYSRHSSVFFSSQLFFSTLISVSALLPYSLLIRLHCFAYLIILFLNFFTQTNPLPIILFCFAHLISPLSLSSVHFFIFSLKSCTCLLFFNIFLCCPPARLPPVRVEESSFSQDLQWLLERGVQFADVAFYGGDCGKELGWAHASVLCAISPYFRQLLVGRQKRERPVSRCTCREREGPHSLMSTWDVGVDDLPRADGHPSGHISRLVVKDPLLCLCLWETLMFLYRGETVSSIKADVVRGKVCLGNQAIYKKEQL